jgi:hypothetical protein
MYIPHLSEKLNNAFSAKPYQGVSPFESKILFVGLDANYRADIESHPIFEKILEYHADGREFWKNYGVHHPFRLKEYTGDGKFYHDSFAKIGLTPSFADKVSFVEVLHVPTIKTSSLNVDDLNASHLSWLNKAITQSENRFIFVPSGVARLMQLSHQFSWLPSRPEISSNGLGVYFRDSRRTIYSHLHFSTYGRFEERKVAEAHAIQRLLFEAFLDA